MGVIIAPFTATERRNLQLQIHNYPFDAIPVYDAPLSSTLRRRARRDKSFVSSRDHNSGGTQYIPPPPPPPPPKDMDNNDNVNSGSGGEDLCVTYHHTHTFTFTCKSQIQPPSSSTVGAMEGDSSSPGISTSVGFPPASGEETTPSTSSSTTSTTISGNSSTTPDSVTASNSGPEMLTSPTPPSLNLPTPTSTAQADVNSSPASTQSPVARVPSVNKAGPIAGGIIGSLVLIFLFILGTILFLRRRRRKRTPASAEFRDQYIPRSHVVTPLAMQGSSEYLDNRDSPDAPPPPFTQGDYSDPLFEKIAETRQAHMQYGFTR